MLLLGGVILLRTRMGWDCEGAGAGSGVAEGEIE